MTDYRELAILRGLLLSPPACDWFTGMGVNLDVFIDPNYRLVAAWALEGCRGSPPAVKIALRESSGGLLTIQEYLSESLTTIRPEWGDRDVVRFTRELAGRWLPRYLEELGKYVKANDGSDHAVQKCTSKYRACMDWLAGEDE